MSKHISTEKYPWHAFGIGVYLFGDEAYLKIDFFKYEVKLGRISS